MSSLLDRLDGDSRAKTWIKAHLDYPHRDWCLIWPFARIQSGYAGFGSRPWTAVHRVMCEYRNGPPPTAEHQAAHSCGRGPDACVNQWHLSWKTNAENQEERFQHDGTGRRYKLTPDQVKQIIELKGLTSVDSLAGQYGVTALTIHRIHAGKLWRKPSSMQHRAFTEAEVRLIRSTPWRVKSARRFANEFGVTIATIEHIRSRRSYKWVTANAEPGSETSRPECGDK